MNVDTITNVFTSIDLDGLASGDFRIADLIVLAIFGLSGFYAGYRGLFRELLSSMAWVGAIVVAILFRVESVEFVQQYVPHDNETLAEVVGPVVFFVVTLAVLMVISVFLIRSLLRPRIGVIDRVLGFFFGVARGIVFVSVGFMVGIWILTTSFTSPNSVEDDDLADTMIENALLLPFVIETSQIVYDLAFGQATQESVSNAADSAVETAAEVGGTLSDQLRQ